MSETPPPPPAAYDFRATLPEDIRADPVFDSIKPKDANEAMALLGKGYVHAQRTIGQARLPKPQKDWKPEQWQAFNKEVGVPEKPEGYETPKVALPKGMELVPDKINGYKKLFHEIGLRPDQAAKLQEFYFTDVVNAHTEQETLRTTTRAQSEAALREEFGDKYDAKLDISRSVIKKFGSEGLIAKLEESGMSNDPDMVRLLSKVGESIMDDSAAGNGDGLPIGERTTASNELNRLKTDTEFMQALNSRSNPGHRAAVERWHALHRAAAGPTQPIT